MSVIKQFSRSRNDAIEAVCEGDVCTFCDALICMPCVLYNRGKEVLICMDCCAAWQGVAADMIRVAAEAEVQSVYGRKYPKRYKGDIAKLLALKNGR